MKKILMFAVGASFLLLAACGGADNYVEGELSGEELYKKSCIGCHGDNFDRIGRIDPVNTFTVEEIADAIVGGKAGMPAGLVKGEDVMVLSEWLAEQ